MSVETKISSPARHAALSVALTLGWLICIELGLQGLVRMPSPLQAKIERKLATGESVESQFRRAFRDGVSDEDITNIGWIADQITKEPLDAKVAIYGMSFTHNIGAAFTRVAPDLPFRDLNGPGSPVNHAYSMYQRDKAKNVRAAIIGVTSIRNVLSMSLDSPGRLHVSGHMFPVYRVQGDGSLQATQPLFETRDQLAAGLEDAERWRQHLTILSDHDLLYNPLLYNRGILEEFVMGRAIMSAIQSGNERDLTDEMHSEDGGFGESELAQESLRTVRHILLDFGKTARARGQLPIVLLVHRPHYADHLYQAFHEDLEAAGIPYVSTHTICPATDATCFGEDNYHFRLDVDDRIAEALLELIPEADKRP